MHELRIAVGMIFPLPRLGVRVQPKPKPPQQLPRRAVRDLMTGIHQRARDLLQALRAPPQRRLRIPARLRIDQRLQRRHQPRIGLRQPRPPRPRPTDPPHIQPRPLPHLRDPTHHRVLTDPRRPHNRRDPTTPMRPRLRSRPQPPLTLVQLRTQSSIPLGNLRFIDHALAIRHHNPTSCHKPRNLFVSPKALFFPLVNAFDVHTPGDGLDTPALVYKDFQSFGFRADSLSASVDGVPIRNLDPTTTPYHACAAPVRGCAPSSFSLMFPDDNLFGLPAGKYAPAVQDGYYLLIAPLRPGRHTVTFAGTGNFN